jgi:hypothetical protein
MGKKKLGLWKRIKGEIGERPYLYGGLAGMGASVAGTLAYPPFAVTNYPAGAFLAGAVPLEFARMLNKMPTKDVKKISKERRKELLIVISKHKEEIRKAERKLKEVT